MLDPKQPMNSMTFIKFGGTSNVKRATTTKKHTHKKKAVELYRYYVEWNNLKCLNRQKKEK